MRIVSILMILGLFLVPVTLSAEEGSSIDSKVIELDKAVEDEAPTSQEPADQANMTEAESWNPTPEWASLRPFPIPDYCPACQPCTLTAQCGRDPHNGSSLGVCSPPPNSWCPGTSTSVCICY